MPRFLTALVASAALAATSLPARAELNVDPGVVVGGLITLGLLGAVLSDRDDHDDKNDHHQHYTQPPASYYTVKPVTRQPQTSRGYRDDAWTRQGHGYGQVKGGRGALPAHCLRDVSRPGQSMTLYGQYCLAQAQVKVKDLPQVCAVRVPTSQGEYTGYNPSCLQARGYRVGLR